MTNTYILKTEPETYGWDDLVREGEALWDGIRNHKAKSLLAEMQPGDRILIYHSGKTREIVGEAFVSQSAFPDPTDSTGKFLAIKVKAVRKWDEPLSLSEMKAMPVMADSWLLTIGRLSVVPVTDLQWRELCPY